MLKILLKIFTLPRRDKIFLSVLSDMLCVCLAYYLSFVIRFDMFNAMKAGNHFQPLFLCAVLPVACLIWTKLGLYRTIVRFVSLNSLHAVLIGAVVSDLLLAALYQIYGISLPWSIFFLYPGLLVFMAFGLRFFIHYLFLFGSESRNKCRVIIYGAGESGRQLAALLKIGDFYRPVAFVDDSPRLQGKLLQGINVYPSHGIGALVQRLNIKKILLAIPSASRHTRMEILDRLESCGVEVLSVPGMNDLNSKSARIDELREVRIEELLGRNPIPPMHKLLARTIAGKSVLVTGAGGSIGSELCRQIVANGAARLVLYEISEVSLYTITRELTQRKGDGTTEIVPLLGNVQDKVHLKSVCRLFNIQTMYHAAAYKHVPIVEYNVVQGIRNNVIGTLNCVEAAIESHLEHFVAISTDKAVRPTNIMGSTKRLAEMIIQTYASLHPEVNFCMVRFGNVLGSSGSVIPLFREQIAKGGPVTVTHTEITRYFMTIPEAVQLVIQAGALGREGEIFVLDMGDPVKILDMAKRMIRLSGLTIRDAEHPDGDMEIRITGLRPGEKLYEELLIEGTFDDTPHPRIRRKHEKTLFMPEMKQLLKELSRACEDGDVARIRGLLSRGDISYTPGAVITDLEWSAGRDGNASVVVNF